MRVFQGLGQAGEMGAVIPAGILGCEGQVIKEVCQDETTGKVAVTCRHDRRYRPVDSNSGQPGLFNRWLRRTVPDMPLGGPLCEVEIKYPGVFLSPTCVRVEALPFMALGGRATGRFALLQFLEALSKECSDGIEAVAIEMGLAYTVAVQKGLSRAAVVFDHFHVMQMFGKVIRDCRHAEFRVAKTLGDLTGEQANNGSLWLLLRSTVVPLCQCPSSAFSYRDVYRMKSTKSLNFSSRVTTEHPDK